MHCLAAPATNNGELAGVLAAVDRGLGRVDDPGRDEDVAVGLCEAAIDEAQRSRRAVVGVTDAKRAACVDATAVE